MKRCYWILLTVGLVWAISEPCRAEEERTPVVNLTLSPAAEPRPALKYQLIVPVHERRPGNAAVLYNRIPAERTAIFGRWNDFWDELHRLQTAPLADLRSEKVRKTLEKVAGVVQDLHTAALFETCDWQLPIHYENFWQIPLPEIQQSRAYARCLVPYARWQIAQGHCDDAILSLRANYALARNVAHGPCAIQCLVGAAIAGITNEQIETFVQQPDAPNLYWALRSLSRPVVDFRPAFEAEIDAVELSFPDLRDLDTKDYSPEQWQAVLDETIATFEAIRSSVNEERPFPKLSMTAVDDGYPRAKRYLIDRGRSLADVEAMPVAQVVLLYTMGIYEEIRDELFKWCRVPYCDGRKGLEEADKKLSELRASGREIIPFASEMPTWVRIARTAETRIDRDYAALIVVEALRLHAASHDGQLPASLADITEVPVPDDPFTGQPFQYRRDGQTAMLESITPKAGKSLRYRIQMRTDDLKHGK